MSQSISSDAPTSVCCSESPLYGAGPAPSADPAPTPHCDTSLYYQLQWRTPPPTVWWWPSPQRETLNHPAAAFIRFIGPCAGFAQLQIKSALYLCGKYQFSKAHTFVSTLGRDVVFLLVAMLKLERMALFIWQRLHHWNPLLFFSCPQMLSWFLRCPSLHNLCCSAMFIHFTFCLMR